MIRFVGDHPSMNWKSGEGTRRVLSEFAPDGVHTHSGKGGLLGAARSVGDARGVGGSSDRS